ncbi:MAG: hypothetical protein AAF384_19665 [Pseudomonadota bacterium]
MIETSADIIVALQEHLSTKDRECTPYRVAKLLDMGDNKGQIYNMLKGRRTLTKTQVIKAAELLGVDPAPLYAVVLSEREKDPDLSKGLKRLASKGMAAAILMSLCITSPANPLIMFTFCILC